MLVPAWMILAGSYRKSYKAWRTAVAWGKQSGSALSVHTMEAVLYLHRILISVHSPLPDTTHPAVGSRIRFLGSTETSYVQAIAWRNEKYNWKFVQRMCFCLFFAVFFRLLLVSVDVPTSQLVQVTCWLFKTHQLQLQRTPWHTCKSSKAKFKWVIHNYKLSE